MKITIAGIDSLTKKLNRLQSLDLTEGLTKGALRVERTAKELVPVDTGLLRSSITHAVDKQVATVGTSISYAADVELGIDQRPQPYLTPALNANREQIKQDISESIRRQLRQIGGST